MQTFNIQIDEISVTPELLLGLLLAYFNTMQCNVNITVEELKVNQQNKGEK